MELTEWYPCTINPIRDGWYEVQRMYSNRPLCAVERMKFEHLDALWDEVIAHRMATFRWVRQEGST